MLQKIRARWSTISTGVLLATVLGLGGVRLYEYVAGDCCGPGASCCTPGAPCCAGHKTAAK